MRSECGGWTRVGTECHVLQEHAIYNDSVGIKAPCAVSLFGWGASVHNQGFSFPD